MPDTVNAWTQTIWDSGTGLTLNGLQEHAGQRLVIVAGDRGGGQTVTLAGSDAGLVAALGDPIVERVTLPGSSTDRRSVWMWSCILPTVDSNPILTCDIRDSANGEQEGSAVAWVVDIDSSYGLAGTAADDSGSSTTTSQATGTTGSVPAGDVVTAVGAMIRGDGTTVWTTATAEPANPGGGTWLLDVTSGTGAGQRHVVGGVGDLGAQGEQTYSDTLTLGTARMTSALIAVWSTGAAGGGTPVGAAVETDAARPLTARKIVTSGAAFEADSTRPAATADQSAVGVAGEVNNARPVAAAKTAYLAPAAESDRVRPMAVVRQVTVGVAREADAANPTTAAKRALLGAAVEHDAARLLSTPGAPLPLGPAGAVDAARPMSPLLTRRIGPARTADAARGTVAHKVGTVGAAHETDRALPAGGPTSSVTPADGPTTTRSTTASVAVRSTSGEVQVR